MNKKVAYIFLVLTFAVLGYEVSAQKEYVILINGDTLFGDVQALNDLASCHEVEVILPDGRTEKFRPRNALKYVRYYDGHKEVYVKEEIRELGVMWPKTGFLRVVTEGKLTILKYNYIAQSGGPMGGASMMGGLEKEDYYISFWDKPVLIKKRDFNIIMSEHVASNNLLANAIRNDKLNYHDLQAIAQIYNGNLKAEDPLAGFQSGFIAFSSGDVIKGRLKRLTPRMSCLAIVFVGEDGIPKEIDNELVSSYVRGDQLYVKRNLVWGPKKAWYSNAYMKLVINGHANLLQHVVPANFTKKSFAEFSSDLVEHDHDKFNIYLEIKQHTHIHKL